MPIRIEENYKFKIKFLTGNIFPLQDMLNTYIHE